MSKQCRPRPDATFCASELGLHCLRPIQQFFSLSTGSKNRPTVFYLITAHIRISAQSRNFVVIKLQTVYFLFCLLLYKGICCGYTFELHRLVDAIQMSIHNMCFFKGNQKKKIARRYIFYHTFLFFFFFFVNFEKPKCTLR